MKISEILEIVDRQDPNAFDPEQKIKWLSDLDAKVLINVILSHEHGEMSWKAYEENELDRELLIPEPYALDCYENYLKSKMAAANLETSRYNQLFVLFNDAYQQFCNFYNRSHRPLSPGGNRLKL